MTDSQKSLQHLLERVFGYSQFRGQQRAVIEHVLAGNDALVLMPTGGGKSMCYQLPALIRDGLTVVVSPLIALMQDQVAALGQSGVSAACLNSSLTFEQMNETEQAVRRGELDLLYVAPERLLQERTLTLLDGITLSLIAIDEAHCVSQWGHDFRPEYLKLGALSEHFPDVPRLALTATADEPTRREILERLRIDEANVFVSGFDRPNIRYCVAPKNNARQQLLAFIRERHANNAGIVYCMSRRKVEATASWLRGHGIDALSYHAGMSQAERRANQQRFLTQDAVVMVATIAFGMGIDKSNVRFVAHLDLPKSIEAYYQETGRAGRDGLEADAWMVYGLQDVVLLRQMVELGDASDERKRIEVQKLNALLGYCELTTCRRRALLTYFAESASQHCQNCDNCLIPPEVWDATEPARMALSCVYRTGQCFGAGHVIDVLMGKVTERITRLGHDRLSTYGIGRQTNVAMWRSVFRLLVAEGFLGTDEHGYGTLRLTDRARPVLRGERSISVRRDVIGSGNKRMRAPPTTATLSEAGSALFDALRAHRRALAENQGVPPYVIFHDAALRAMANERPRTREQFALISGVGEKKLVRYADSFIAVIAEHSRNAQPVADSNASQRV